MTKVVKNVDFDLENPNAWQKIPEFGVKPSEVNFVSFASSVFIPKLSREVSENLTCLIGAARGLAQREFKKYEDLQRSGAEALDVIFKAQDADPNWEISTAPYDLTDKQRAGVLYTFFALDVARITGVIATPNRRLEALASAASFVVRWATEGAEDTLKRMQERNAKNAKAPRPQAQTVDHQGVLSQFNLLVREGHTEREARGILLMRGNMGSQSSIYRITKK